MIKKLLSSQLRINMASGMATTVVNIAVMAAGYPIYLHFLGYEKYGVWLVLAVVLTFAQLGDIGINPAITKLVAISAGGTSFDEQYKNANGESGYFERSLAVYGQEGEPCPRCGSAIARIAFANRSSHLCQRCQR